MIKPIRTTLLAAVVVGLYGTVTLADPPEPVTYIEVEIEPATGQVIDARLTKSTGDPKQDAAILKQWRKWRFKRGRHMKIPILLANPKK